MNGYDVDLTDKSAPVFSCSDAEAVEYFMRVFEVPRRAGIVPAISSVATQLES